MKDLVTDAAIDAASLRDAFIRTMQRVEITESCWNWTGVPTNRGYGSIRSEGRSYKTHRVVYEFIYRVSLAPEETIDHLCRNKICVNPYHLEVVSSAENSRRRAGFYNVPHEKCGKCGQSDWIAGAARQCRPCLRQTQRDYKRRTGIEHLIAQAYKSLGITRAEYRNTYDQSRSTAIRVLTDLGIEVPND